MYVIKPGIKQDPARRWELPDRIFFGHGACHILAGVFLERFPNSGFDAMWIRPSEGFRGSHIFVTDGQIAYDYHGYSIRERLVIHHEKGWASRFPGWDAQIVAVDFPLLDTVALNARNMRGPDQYFGDVLHRTRQFLDRANHQSQRKKARKLL